jgi:hypothetical protein
VSVMAHAFIRAHHCLLPSCEPNPASTDLTEPNQERTTSEKQRVKWEKSTKKTGCTRTRSSGT